MNTVLLGLDIQYSADPSVRALQQPLVVSTGRTLNVYERRVIHKYPVVVRA